MFIEGQVILSSKFKYPRITQIIGCTLYWGLTFYIKLK